MVESRLVQLVIRRKNTRTGQPVVFLRAVPYTVWSPTDAQLLVRQEFARVSKLGSGVSLAYDPETGMVLPGSAVTIKREMKGLRVSSRKKPAKWEMILREYFRQQGIEVSTEELRKTLYTYLESK
jgi:hypothetical protein